MVKYLVFLICTLIVGTINAQSPIGAWEAYSTSETGEKIRRVVIFADGYQVISIYNANTGKFIHSNGGTWTLEGDTMTEVVEFDTDNAERVGTEQSFNIALSDSTLQIVGDDIILSRIDKGQTGDLQGAWLMSGRIRDGNTQLRDINRPRKTMKILSDTRFQWIAYNTETKEFMGTGGGTYTSKNGDYVETIEFFSRDDSKAGLRLPFTYELIEGNWHHIGLSSKGEPFHEIWTVRD